MQCTVRLIVIAVLALMQGLVGLRREHLQTVLDGLPSLVGRGDGEFDPERELVGVSKS